MVSEFDPARPPALARIFIFIVRASIFTAFSTSRRQFLVPLENSFGGNVSYKSCSLKKYIYALTHILQPSTHTKRLCEQRCKMCERTHKVLSGARVIAPLAVLGDALSML